jgi:multidrug efflux pump subunit AcrA (membrane-fusion protein)
MMENNPLITSFMTKLKVVAFICLALCLGSIALWSVTAEISSAVVTNGSLQLVTPALSVKSPANGELNTVEVSNGQQVNKGDLLMVLNSDKETARLTELTSEYWHWLALKNDVFTEQELIATAPRPQTLPVKDNQGVDISSVTDKIRREQTTPEDMAQVKYRILQKLTALKKAIIEVTNTIEAKNIKAPLTGIIYDLAEKYNSQQLSYGQELLKILPEDNHLHLKLNIKAQDRSKLTLGQASRVVFSTISSRDSPSLTGTITEIAPAALINQLTGEYLYPVKLSLVDVEVFEKKWQVELVEGMNAEVYLNVSKTTPASYLLKSIKQSLSRAWNE